MNLDSLSFSLSQISYLVANLSKKNYKTSTQELSRLVASEGAEADRHLLRCLFSELDAGLLSGSNREAIQPVIQLLAHECSILLTKPSLVTNICSAIDNPLLRHKSSKLSAQLLPQLSRLLKLTPVQEVVFAIALEGSDNQEIYAHASAFLQQRLPDLVGAYIKSDASSGSLTDGGLHDTTPEVLHLVLSHVLLSPSKAYGFTEEIKDLLLQNLCRDFPRELVPIVLAPLLYPDCADLPMDKVNQEPMTSNSIMMEPPLWNVVLDLGYRLTGSADELRAQLRLLGVREVSAQCVARTLALMAASHTGLSDVGGSFWLGPTDVTAGPPKDKAPTDQPTPTTWAVDVFVQLLKELVPGLNWSEVIVGLDHADFLVKDRQGLTLIFTALRLGLQGQGCHPERFPADLLYRPWTHVEAQFSLTQQILKNPDVFCFADYPYHPVIVDILKAPPENDTKEIATWRSLDLVEMVLYLAERGLTGQVQELLKVPIQHCPDVLVLALLQINDTRFMQTRHDLLTLLVPIFLGTHPNSAIVLHHAWHSPQFPNIKSLIMQAMAEWYIRGDNDQARLSRILDVAQDLKALSLLLNAQAFPFIIDLACLASRREYLKLEKWITDKIREHGESFLSACIKFLQRRCPQLMGGLAKEENLPKSAQLPPDTVSVMCICLQGCASSMSPEMSETVMTMLANASMMLSKPRAPLPSVIRAQRGLDPFNPAVALFPGAVDSLAGADVYAGGFSLPAGGGGLGPLVSGSQVAQQQSQSPSRGLQMSALPPAVTAPPSQSPAQGTQFPHGLAHGPAIPRLAPQPQQAAAASVVEKARIGDNASQLFPEMTGPVSKEVEDEANSYFQRIYNHPPHPTLSIDEVLDMLSKFQDSPNKHEKEVFNCMLRNLFEEYRFFPQYPDKELHITAQLFGGIIERGLVQNFMALGLALRFTLEALRKQHGSKMYYFGIAALDRFKSRLKEFHKYCEHIVTIPHFAEFPQHLIEYVQYGLESQEPPSRPQGPILPPMLAAITTVAYRTVTATTTTTTTVTSTTATTVRPATTSAVIAARPSIANATNIDTLLVATEQEACSSPPEIMQDKVAFIFNNLSQLNLQTKCDELREIVTEEYWMWLSQYLVMKRASIELNFHNLYFNFLDELKISEVNTMVLRETYRNIRVLLRSDKGIANFSDRSLLKNLGHWLGMQTLGRNKPILQPDLDLKALMVEAYSKGQQELLYVVPFVAKVLESCAKSRVFKPPNPWTISIMNVLAELHQESDLKLNLKFEIEVLCKNLNLDVSELKPSLYLKNPDSIKSIDLQLSPTRPKTAEPVMVAPTTVMQQPQPTPQTAATQPGHQQVAQASAVATVTEELREMTIAPPPSTTPTLALVAATPCTTAVTVPANAPPPEPRFSYQQLNTPSIASLAAHITINSTLPLFQAHPQLKQFVRPAVERAVQEWLHPVVERSIKIAITTSEQIVKKDFALDPEESRLRAAAHHMVRNLTAGMAMITCRDQLLISISTNLKTSWLSALLTATPQQEMIDQAATVSAQDNMELGCAFIQKTAMEKALPEIDKHIQSELERRRQARADGARYCDSAVLTYQAQRMPEQIRLKTGGVIPQQMNVYEDFARNIPGFQPISACDGDIFIPKPVAATTSTDPLMTVVSAFPAAPTTQLASYTGPPEEVGTIYDKLINDLEGLLQNVLVSSSCYAAPMHSLMDCLLVASSRVHDQHAALQLLQKAVEGLLDQPAPGSDAEVTLRYRDIHLRVIRTLQDPRACGLPWTAKNVTRCLMECRDDFRFNHDMLDLLLRSQLINLPMYDSYLAHAMDNGLSYNAVAFAIQLVQHYLVDDRANSPITEADVPHTVEVLMKIATHTRLPHEGLLSLLEMLRSSHDQTQVASERVGPVAHIHSGILQVRGRDCDDPPGLFEKTELLLRDWVSIYHSNPGTKDSGKSFSMFVHQMNVQGILKTDDLITRFFRLSTHMVVELCYRLLNEPGMNPPSTRSKIFHTLDAYVRLIALLVKHSGDSSNTATKINLLNKVLGIVAGLLLQDHEQHHTEFQQLPYHRVFIMLFMELNAPEPILEAINFQVLTAFCQTLHILCPSKSPGFAYAWLELVSHRIFIGRLLALTPQQKGWAIYSQLLIDLFKFLAPFLRNAELAKPVTLLYKGTLRVLLVLLHDFPEFLCDYHYGFCDVIPPNCIQMRNLILSAFPRNMRLPDPFTPNLKVDLLVEITHAPRVLTPFANHLQPKAFKTELDSYLKARAPVTFLSELRSNLQVSHTAGMRYNIPLLNALVLYVGTQAISHIRNKALSVSMSTIAHSAHMDIFQNLAVDLDTEGRYLFLNAIANQLRYPNSHTHYFSCTLLYLFAEANTEAIQEQVTRVLLERLIVNRPHPWGLLITFIELIKNPSYKFWNHEFVHCAPEIEKLFESVARSCMVQKQLPCPTENDISEL